MADTIINTPYGTEPGVFAGAQAAAVAINKTGGINGHKVQIVTCNTQATVAGSTACAEEAVKDKVLGVVGFEPYDSIETPILAKANIPSSYFTDNGSTYQSNAEFPVNGGAWIEYVGAAVAAKHAGVTKLGIVCLQFEASPTQCKDEALVAAKLGMQVVATVDTQLTSTTFTAQVQQLQSAGADGVIFSTILSQAPAIVEAANAIGFRPTWAFGYSAAHEGQLAPIAALTSKLWAASSYPPITSLTDYPGLQAFQDEMNAARKAGVKNVSLANENAEAVGTWAAVHGLAQVATKIKGSPTAPKLMAALRKAKNVKIGSLVTWTPDHIGAAPYPGLTPSDTDVYVGPIDSTGTFAPKPRLPVSATDGVNLQ